MESSTVAPGNGTCAQLTPSSLVLRIIFSVMPQPRLEPNMCSSSSAGPLEALSGGVGVIVGVGVNVGKGVNVRVGVIEGGGGGRGVAIRSKSQASEASIKKMSAGISRWFMIASLIVLRIFSQAIPR